MRPAPHPETSPSAADPVVPKDVLPAAPAAADVPAAPAPARQDAPSPFSPKPPRPIGPEALKALREAIRSGKYPSEDAVRSGLERLIRRPE